MEASIEMEPVAFAATETDIEKTFAKQKTYAPSLRISNAEQRIQKLKNLKAQLDQHKAEIYQACAADFGKPEAEVDLMEFFPVYAELNDAVRQLKKWMKPKRVATPLSMIGTSSFIQYEPKGTSLIISPWNYPVNLTFCPLISAIAAGCTAIVKPSEMTPNLSKVICSIIEASFPSEEVAAFEGGVEVSTELLAQPFDHIFFTGAPQIGKIVMTAAAKHLSSVTLELGGKSPVIVDDSADIKQAAKSILWGKFNNAGQTCIAPDYLFVHESIRDEFINNAKDIIAHYYGKTAEQQQSTVDFCRIVNTNHYRRVAGLLDDALDQGASLIAGGVKDEATRYVAPTLIDNVSSAADIMHEEIFGPILPIITYTDIDHVVDTINSKPKPLALYIFSKDKNNTQHILKTTTAGGTTVNGIMLHFSNFNLPFGGVNNSGIGSSHGFHGFKAFSHERAVVKNHFSLATMLYPPYKPRVKKMIKTTLKLFG